MNVEASDKFRRYRAAKQARGLRQLRLWVADVRGPGFPAEAARQAALLRGAVEEADALDVIERVSDRSGWAD